MWQQRVHGPTGWLDWRTTPKATPKPKIRADPAARLPGKGDVRYPAGDSATDGATDGTSDGGTDCAADGAAGGAYSSGGAADRPVERVHLVIAAELILN